MRTIVGWRKWAMGMIALGMLFALAVLGKLTTEFVNGLMFVVGAFTAGNTIEHAVKKPDSPSP